MRSSTEPDLVIQKSHSRKREDDEDPG